MEDKPRYSRVSDILDLVTFMLANPQGVTVPGIMDRYGVSRRTAERMRDSLLNIFPDVEELDLASDGLKHWGFTNRAMFSRLVNFTPEEIADLEQLKTLVQNSHRLENLKRVIEKIKAISTKHQTSAEDEIEMLLHTEGYAVKQKSNYRTDINTLRTLRDAIRESKVVTGIYHNKPRTLKPLGLIYGEKTYLVAKEDAKGDGIYNFILHKLKNVSLTSEFFDNENFNLEEYSKQSFVVFHGEILDVKLLFSPQVAEDILCYNFHPTQTVTQQPDGSVLVSFQASGELDIIWHLFKWGANVKILSPEKLKETYRNYIKSLDLT